MTEGLEWLPFCQLALMGTGMQGGADWACQELSGSRLERVGKTEMSGDKGEMSGDERERSGCCRLQMPLAGGGRRCTTASARRCSRTRASERGHGLVVGKKLSTLLVASSATSSQGKTAKCDIQSDQKVPS